MDSAVFLAVLAAAALHAGWNAMVKGGGPAGSRATGMLLVAAVNGVVGLLVALVLPWPPAGVWVWIVASGVIRTAYYLALGYAYEHGDLSRVYPVARGAAPLFVLLCGGFFMADRMTGGDVAGILLLGAGILLMARGVFSEGESRRLLPFAVVSAMATAGYSVTDGTGARLAGDAVAFTGWALAVTAVFYVPVLVALKGSAVLRAGPAQLRSGLLAGLASYVAYTIVVWAMTQAPVALVAALRETSILFAVLIGWLVFGERLGRGKLMASVMIVAGVAVTRIWQG
jgi:drug/metabolite transporter (DMT)-like permease